MDLLAAYASPDRLLHQWTSMPDKPLTVATYAAGASLAAVTLVYVFGPTFFIDGDASARRKGVVGLHNPANDCFINSVLQSLAGLGELRLFLIREVHRRRLDGPAVYAVPVADAPRDKRLDAGKLEGLRAGLVTRALKDVLDALNERPLQRKTISANGFLRVLERAFRQTISRQQQDAQEFLQIVAERLSDEYQEGRKARNGARKRAEDAALAKLEKLRLADDMPADSNRRDGADDGAQPPDTPETASRGNTPSSSEAGNRRRDMGVPAPSSQISTVPPSRTDEAGATPKSDKAADEKPSADDSQKTEAPPGARPDASPEPDEPGFPLEGKLESQIECQTCHFKPKPHVSTFVTLTLNVPQQNTTLGACFDGLFKTEHIDDFKCDRCRLKHAMGVRAGEAERASSQADRARIRADMARIEAAMRDDPEKPPEDLALPSIKVAPKRRISRHMRVTAFPRVLAVHLSRSIFDPRSLSRKNSAKVSFPEKLALGGILDRKTYRLLGVVTHWGNHNSGHYESFRRQNLYTPFSTPNTFSPSLAYGAAGTPLASVTPSLDMGTSRPQDPPDTPRVTAVADVSSDMPTADRPSPAPAREPSVTPVSPERSPVSAAAVPSPAPSSPPPRDSSDGFISLKSLSSSLRRTRSTAATSATRSASADAKPPSPPTAAASGSEGVIRLGSKRRRRKRVAASAVSATAHARERKQEDREDRWWRISDEKVKEARTHDVLGMQKEVYLLFYELERPDPATLAASEGKTKGTVANVSGGSVATESTTGTDTVTDPETTGHVKATHTEPEYLTTTNSI